MTSLLCSSRESFVLKNLEGCTVYLLDYSGEVEVTNVTNSQIFIGTAPASHPSVNPCVYLASQSYSMY